MDGYQALEPVPVTTRALKWTGGVLAFSAAIFGAGYAASYTPAGEHVLSALHTVRESGNRVADTPYTHSFKRDAIEVLLYKRTHPSRNPVRFWSNIAQYSVI